MYKFQETILVMCLFAAAACGGLIETHHVVHQPVLAKVGAVVHSAPSAVSHQSITQVHSKTVVQPVLAPVVKTTLHAAPVVHAAPILHSVPVEHSAPVLHSLPVVHSVHSSPVVHSVSVAHAAPVLKTVISSPLAYSLHHH